MVKAQLCIPFDKTEDKQGKNRRWGPSQLYTMVLYEVQVPCGCIIVPPM